MVTKASPAAVVVTALSGPEAIAYLLEASQSKGLRVAMPALILLDLNMPGMDGYEVLEWVRHNPWLACIKVVMLSTCDSEAESKRASALGAHGFLIKYPHPAVFACMLREIDRANPGVSQPAYAVEPVGKSRVMESTYTGDRGGGSLRMPTAGRGPL